ncbi:hypothetical protein EYF80_044342 [Liparis tanakae]|uniref:Uncharacterized protein n=1 Tax=Liparis tanakae TaxID=230148 RepID=A0A4Z2FXL5_9TELE|nr:hypothetical protein EYF80_044342 [Liparis tanakae]
MSVSHSVTAYWITLSTPRRLERVHEDGSLFIIIVIVSVSQTVTPPLSFSISIPHSVLSRYIGGLSIPCGRPPSGEAHFLILELPERQRVTGLGRPTKKRSEHTAAELFTGSGQQAFCIQLL